MLTVALTSLPRDKQEKGRKGEVLATDVGRFLQATGFWAALRAASDHEILTHNHA
jgi:hypothetical protein